jgi:hypothetical protein
MAKHISVGNTIRLTVEGRTAMDQLARLPTQPEWRAEPPGLLTLRIASDALTCEATAAAPGDVTVTVTCGDLAAFDFAITILPGTATRLHVKAEP